MSATENVCPHCGKPVTTTALGGLCPECMILAGAAADTGEIGPDGTVVTRPPVPPVPSVAELAPHFPQLEILECLGRGGMGAVYKARQPKLDRLVALKILARPRDSGIADADFAARFQQEARALARLNHPDIVAVYDFGEAGGYHYLLMEFVDGLTLRQLLQTKKISPEEALAIVPKICEALQFAHERGIVHRDIKPENILLDKQGCVKIADFGIAKILGAQADGGSLTGMKDVIGTPHYMAPEQVEKPTKVDHRADIYSLGVVFYEMLTGELPLGKFSPPSKKVHVDVRLDEVVLHALEKEPERRYQHASEVKTDVETIANSPSAPGPTAKKPAPLPVLGWRDRWLWERNVIAFGFVPCVLLLFVGLLLVPYWGGHVTFVLFVFPLAAGGMGIAVAHAWVGHRIRQMKAALPQGEAEVAEGWLAWEQGVWPFNRSQGLAVLHPDRLELVPVWHGSTITVPLADITSVHEVRWLYVPLFWKRGFVLQLANGERIGLAVPAPFGRRWRTRLSGDAALAKEPERRYQHASEMKTDAERISNTPASAPTAAPRVEPGTTAVGKGRWPFPLVVLRDGQRKIHWRGVLVCGFILAGAYGTAWFACSLALSPFLDSGSIGSPLGGAVGFVAILLALGIYRGLTVPANWLASVDADGQVRTAAEPIAPMPSGSGKPEAAQTAKAQVRGPANWLVATGILNWLAVPVLVGLTAAIQSDHVRRPLLALVLVLGMVLGSFVIFAAFKMKQLKAYGAAIVASILAMIMSPGNLVGLPVGIWVLVTLTRREVRAAFARSRTGAGSSSGVLLKAAIGVVAVLVLALAFILSPNLIPRKSVPSCVVPKVEHKLEQEIEQRLHQAHISFRSVFVTVAPDLRSAECALDDLRREVSQNLFENIAGELGLRPAGRTLWSVKGKGGLSHVSFTVDTSAEMNPPPDLAESEWAPDGELTSRPRAAVTLNPGSRANFARVPPVVIKTEPESGAAGVDPALKELRVTFSQPMQAHSGSISRYSDADLPQPAGELKFLDDQRTWVMPVQLQPGRVYAIWLNSGQENGFQDRAGQLAVPYLLIFETRK